MSKVISAVMRGERRGDRWPYFFFQAASIWAMSLPTAGVGGEAFAEAMKAAGAGSTCIEELMVDGRR